MTEDVNEQAPACPNCCSTDVVAILYGSPTLEGFEMVQRGERELGGCVVSHDSPMWACKACQQRFGNHLEFWSQRLPALRARLEAQIKRSSEQTENKDTAP